MPDATWTMAQLRRHFWMIPAERILRVPLPGTATERDVLNMNDHHNRLCELVDGTLLEKPMGSFEGLLAGFLLHYINAYFEEDERGVALAPDGFLRYWPGLVRAPDVSVILWDSIPGDDLPTEPIWRLVPDWAIEIYSKSNTRREMTRKRQECFSRGTRLFWQVYPTKKAVEVYTSVDQCTTFNGDAVLDGGDVLPGFKLPLTKLFAPRRRPRKRG